MFASLLRVLVTNKKFSVPFKYLDFMFLPIQFGELEETKKFIYFLIFSVFFLILFFRDITLTRVRLRSKGPGPRGMTFLVFIYLLVIVLLGFIKKLIR